jgi:NADPH-dependent 2,4-dienoyl-CoA reductase/sulfur reductase-like enzyme
MKIVIVGATAAGTTAAAKLRRNLPNATIIMMDRGMVTSFGACGLPYFVGGFFTNEMDMIARTPEEFMKSGIEMRTRHEAIGLDSKAQSLQIKNLDTGKVYTEAYDRLLIATGAHNAPPPFPVSDDAPTYALRTLEDGVVLHKALREPHVKHVVIIGAGFIGLEMVEATHKLGLTITLMDHAPLPMANAFDVELSEFMRSELIAHGVHIQFSCCIKSIEKNVIYTNNGSITADLIIMCMGIAPSTQWLADSGIAMSVHGVIQVNRNSETNAPHVYALGDCAMVYHSVLNQQIYSPLATVANKLGRFVADRIAGSTTDFSGMMNAASVKVLDLEAVRVGLGLEEARAAGMGEVKSSLITDKDHASYYPDAQIITIKLVYLAQGGRIIGAQVVGKRGAALRGTALSIAVAKGVTVQELGMLDLPYSPPFTRTWDALNVAGNASK